MKNINFTIKRAISGVLWLSLLAFAVWLIEQQDDWPAAPGGMFYISHYFYTAQQKKVVTERHLFGEPHVVESDGDNAFRIYDHPLSEYIIQHAPESESPVKLTGIVYSVDADAAMITVASDDNVQQTYHAGDVLSPGNEKILLILMDEIIIDSNGYYRSLHFKND
ncbi:type II secretion system protein N [Dickeya dadantii subsp. dieffenbachiae]|uniref:type II secretion system protein N n=1 Tax=Dickeya dadantii TaxID=204038 RepID=UPI0005762F14|nr:type II secretion system protein N [Dickeya dadantii]MCA7012895.1 hypothetical protein [Dickeya dadantii]QWT41166.1 hypothetical protein KNV89_01035 [Dickeya dadantii]